MAHFAIPTHIIVGNKALEEATAYFCEYGKKALIVTGPHVSKSPMVSELKNLLEKLEIEYRVFDQISGEPTDIMVESGVKLFKEEGY